MVQEFHVLRCHCCLVFQVQQVKKVNRWICKMCGQKQSLVKEFGRGSAADCRRHVQKLNAARAKMEEHRAHLVSQDHRDKKIEEEQLSHKPESRWDKYRPAPCEGAELTAQGAELAAQEVEPENQESVVLDRNLLRAVTCKTRPVFQDVRLPYPRSVPHVSESPPRASQPRASQPRASQPRASQPRAISPRAISPRAISPRAISPRASPPRASPPRASPPRDVSKWSRFLKTASGASIMFQSEEDFDLDLTWT